MNVCTAVGAIDSKKNYTITFKSEAHKIFYQKNLPECRYQDVYHKALVYCLGIDADTRNHVNSIYDFKTGCVKTKCLNEGCLSISDYGLGRRLPRILRMNSDKKRSNPLTDDESISVTAHVITNSITKIMCLSKEVEKQKKKWQDNSEHSKIITNNAE